MTNPITSYNGNRIADMGDEELLRNYLISIMALRSNEADAMHDAILLRMSQPKWVKVDNPPEQSGEYWGWLLIEDVSQNPNPSAPNHISDKVYFRKGIGWRYVHYGVFVKPTVQFWMPLPEPPKESL